MRSGRMAGRDGVHKTVQMTGFGLILQLLRLFPAQDRSKQAAFLPFFRIFAGCRLFFSGRCAAFCAGAWEYTS